MISLASIAGFFYFLLGSVSIGYLFLRSGWPGFRAKEASIKSGWSIIFGAVFALLVGIASFLADFFWQYPAGFENSILVNLIACAAITFLTLTLWRKFFSGKKRLRVVMPKDTMSANIAATKAVNKLAEENYFSSPALDAAKIEVIKSTLKEEGNERESIEFEVPEQPQEEKETTVDSTEEEENPFEEETADKITWEKEENETQSETAEQEEAQSAEEPAAGSEKEEENTEAGTEEQEETQEEQPATEEEKKENQETQAAGWKEEGKEKNEAEEEFAMPAEEEKETDADLEELEEVPDFSQEGGETQEGQKEENNAAENPEETKEQILASLRKKAMREKFSGEQKETKAKKLQEKITGIEEASAVQKELDLLNELAKKTGKKASAKTKKKKKPKAKKSGKQ